MNTSELSFGHLIHSLVLSPATCGSAFPERSSALLRRWTWESLLGLRPANSFLGLRSTPSNIGSEKTRHRLGVLHVFRRAHTQPSHTLTSSYLPNVPFLIRGQCTFHIQTNKENPRWLRRHRTPQFPITTPQPDSPLVQCLSGSTPKTVISPTIFAGPCILLEVRFANNQQLVQAGAVTLNLDGFRAANATTTSAAQGAPEGNESAGPSSTM